MDFEIPTSPKQSPVHAVASFPQPTKPPPWEYLIVSDLFLSELSSGIFVAAALGDLIAQNVYGEAARIGYLLALTIIVVDLICLVLDLGDPIRFHHMLRVCKFSSPMSSGMWVLGVYSFVAFVCFMLAAIDLPVLREPRAIIAGVGLPAAFFVGGYKGVMLSATAQPVWKDSRWLGAELVSSAGLLGVAALMLVSLFLPVASAIPGLRLAQLVMLFVNLALSITFMIHAVRRLIGEHRSRDLVILSCIAAVAWIAPIILTFVGGLWILAASACLIIIGAAAFRQDLVMLPHKVA
jgi:Ni/Fe-hydrogenase subunit HybB-like protein